MLPPRILGLLVILLAVQGFCQPTKSNEDEDYEDDTPVDEEEDDDENIDDDNLDDAPPQILSPPMSVRVMEGSTVILPCDVVHADTYAITWEKGRDYLYFDGTERTVDSKRIILLPNNTLIIYNATASDSSNEYRCSILQANDKSIVLTHRLLVDSKGSFSPTILEQPATASPPTIPTEPVPSKHPHPIRVKAIPEKRIKVNQGESITFGCETNKQPSPEIKWFLESKKLIDYDPNVVIRGNYITIKKVNKSHSGRYQCLVEDGSQRPAMEAITITVHYPPEVEAKRSIVYSGTSIDSEMMCIVSAYPKAIIKWYKDDKEITQKKNSIIFHHGEMKGNRTRYILKILRTTEQDFGEYKCTAENPVGEDHRTIILTGVPSQAKLLGAEMTTDDTGIILKWRLESYSPINEYKLQYRRKGEETWSVATPEVRNGIGNQFTVEHPIGVLEPGAYEAILEARNSFGWSPASEPHMFTGDYPPEMARKEENSAAIQIRPPGILLASILVVLSCAFTSL